jgi:hypothetical protein
MQTYAAGEQSSSGGEKGVVASWPPPAVRKLKSAADLQVLDNITGMRTHVNE